ncbi:MAG: protein phosphatase 2C domain-containing protein, partial [Clostridia bacterium]|nr:protein phosphatase 2C domain-containing protein [Clostridia bacterium]
MDFAFASCIGNRVINEDSYSTKEKNGSYCFTVCDGLGGHAKGEIASKSCADTFSEEFENFSGDTLKFFQTAFDSAAERFRNLAKESPVLELMKTTVVSLVISGEKCSWAHIGDSRLYGFQNGKAVLCTSDHSVPEMLVKSGEKCFNQTSKSA